MYNDIWCILPQPSGWREHLRDGLLILGGLVIYGLETSYGLRLLQSDRDTDALYSLATLLTIIYIFGIARALIGNLQFPIQDRQPHQIDKEPA